MTDFPTLLRGPATVKDEMTAIYLSAKDARRAADYVDRLEADNARLKHALVVWDQAHRTGKNEPLAVAFDIGKNALQDTTT